MLQEVIFRCGKENHGNKAEIIARTHAWKWEEQKEERDVNRLDLQYISLYSL